MRRSTTSKLRFERYSTASRPADSPNESQTEDDLIWPVLDRLGWTASLRQQNLTPRGREDVPDGLLFADDAAKDPRQRPSPRSGSATSLDSAVVESKRWLRPLEIAVPEAGERGIAPSTQMLRYLRRVDDLTSGHLRWGILTNGARWRLYYQGARSVSEQFFEIDLAALLDLPGHNESLFALYRARAPPRSEAVHPVLPPGSVPPRRRRLAHVCTRGRWKKAGSTRSGWRPTCPIWSSGAYFPDLAPRHCRPSTRRAAWGRCAMPPLVVLYPPALHPVRRGPGSASRCATSATTTTASATRCAATWGGARTAATPSRRLPPGTGRRSTIFAGRLTQAIRPSVSRPTTAGSSTERVPRCSPGSDWAIGSWPTSSTLCRSRQRRRVGDTSTTATLSVQQLGSIYERLLEHEIAREGDEIVVPPECLRTQGFGQLLHPGRARGSDSRRDDRAAGTRPARGFRHGDGEAPQEPTAPSVQADGTETPRSGQQAARFSRSAIRPWDQVTSWSASWITWRIG